MWGLSVSLWCSVAVVAVYYKDLASVCSDEDNISDSESERSISEPEH
jgi:hypothetical protein